MNDKQQLIDKLRDEFNRWQEVLGTMSEAQIETPIAPSIYSTKDVMAHLWGWQQRSIARLEAALYDREPQLPQWPVMPDPAEDEEENVDKINQWIYESNRDRTWTSVHEDWRNGFLRFVELAQAIPEEAYFVKGKYTWLAEWPLAKILESSWEHHQEEHLEPLQAWLHQHKAIGKK